MKNVNKMIETGKAQKVVILIKKFEISEDAPAEARLAYRLNPGELYRAVKDVTTNAYYLDSPEMVEADGVQWVLEGTANDSDYVHHELQEVTADDILDLKIDDKEITKFAEWIADGEIKMSWEEVNKIPAKRKDSSEDGFEELAKEVLMEIGDDQFEVNAQRAMKYLKEHRPEMFLSLSILLTNIGLQETGRLPMIADTERNATLASAKIPNLTTMGALLNSHAVRAATPNMTEIFRLVLHETTRINKDMYSFILKDNVNDDEDE